MNPSTGQSGGRLTPASLAALLAVAIFPLACWLRLPGLSGIRTMQIGYAVAAAGWLYLVWVCSGSRGFSLYRSFAAPPLAWLLVTAVAVRFALLPLPPSDDLYRYVWEGLVRTHGVNPYATAPDDPSLAQLRPPWFSQINHPDHTAIYPPLAQVMFTGLARVAPRPIAFKLLMLAADLGAIWLLLRAARRRRAPPQCVAVYALCPLVLTAFAREGHIDALMVLGLTLVLYAGAAPAALRWSDVLAVAAGLGLAIGSKWVALLLVPWAVVRALRPLTRAQVVRCAAMLVLTGLIIALPALAYLDHGPAALFRPLRNFATSFHNLDYFRQILLEYLSARTAQYLSLLAIGGVAIGVAARRGDAPRAMLWSLGALILLAPTVHPWYLTWLLPALCLRPAWPWLVLAVSMVFAYEGDHLRETTGTWAQPEWVAPAVWWPLMVAAAAWGLMALGHLRARRDLDDSGNRP